jgi:sarcosine oxidase subunit gamma
VADPHTFKFQPGRFGQPQGAAGVTVGEITDFGLASVLARRGRGTDVARLVLSAHGVALPETPRAVEARDATFIWSGPGHWLVLTQQALDLEARIRHHLGESASVFAQGDSRVLLELSGPRARDVLAKGVPVDLDPAVFRTGDAANTTTTHLSLLLWQVSDAPVYRLLAMRTWFDSFWHGFAASAAEYGCEVLPSRTLAPGP